MKKLGFGCMRFPVLENGKINATELKQMVEKFMERGFTYYDTSYVYHNGDSEKVLKEVLVDRYPRDRFTITTKLPSFMVTTKEEMQKIFNEQLERLGTDYIDYYLLHAMNEPLYNTMGNTGFDFLRELKENGKIKHIGFSFHDTPELLERMLNEHSEVEFVQLQLNYIDWTSSFVKSKECYEVCERHNVKVIVMEPVKGGGLVNLPEEAEKGFKEYNSDLSNASWAIRWCASLPNVYMVLSGMSNLDQVLDNTGFMENFNPMNDEELSLVKKAADVINNKSYYDESKLDNITLDSKVDETVKKYIRMYNEHYKMNCYTNLFVYYTNLTSTLPKASECISYCNDYPEIVDVLEKMVESFEN